MRLIIITSIITLGNIYAVCRVFDIIMLIVVMLSVVAPSEAGTLNKSMALSWSFRYDQILVISGAA